MLLQNKQFKAHSLSFLWMRFVRYKPRWVKLSPLELGKALEKAGLITLKYTQKGTYLWKPSQKITYDSIESYISSHSPSPS
jgi:hypothetical protein